MRLVSHVNNEGDILQAWFDHYIRFGITCFHLIVHGSATENSRLFELKNDYPIVIEDTYEGEFSSEEKRKRLNPVLTRLRGQWLILVDSDEFLELPYRTLANTVRILELLGANALYAPMLQRITGDGSLETSDIVCDPFVEFPLCCVDLYATMGARTASIRKFPLFRCGEFTALTDGGNHNVPNGSSTVLAELQGVTHHFKWRRTVLTRLSARINSAHTWRHESITYQDYLSRNGFRLPTADCFMYSRRELFRRGLLRRTTISSALLGVMRNVFDYLPAKVQNPARFGYRALRRRLGAVLRKGDVTNRM